MRKPRRPDHPAPRIPARLGALLIAGVLAGILASPPATAESEGSGSRLKEVEKALEAQRARQIALKKKSRDLARSVTRLRRASIGIANRTQGLERKVAELEDKITALANREQTMRSALHQRRFELGRLLAALQRLAHNPPEALIAQPGTPVDTLRSAVVLRGTLPQVEARAASLRGALEELASVRSKIDRQRTQLQESQAALAKQRVSLAGLLGRKSRLEKKTQEEDRKATVRITRLAGEAKDLRDLITRLAADRKAATDRRKRHKRQQSTATRATPTKETGAKTKKHAMLIEQPPAGVPASPGSRVKIGPGNLPVVGRIKSRFGDKSDRINSAQGVYIATGGGAQVVSPVAGEVAYAGSYRRYGLLLIIRESDRYHMILAGMDRLNVTVGQKLLAGEPVGVMGKVQKSAPTLYLELRKRGEPVNPLPWLAASRRGATG